MDMADGQHSSKRQRHNGISETWHGAANSIVLPPLSSGQPHQYQPNRSLSSPHNFAESPGSYEFNKATPTSMQEPRHLPGIFQIQPLHHSVQQQYHNENVVKKESEVLSPRPHENGHQFSPPYRSHTYDSNGGIPSVPQYPNHRTPVLASPTASIGPIRPNVEPIYAQSPDTAVNSNDGIYNHSQHHYAQPPPNNIAKKKAQRASQACDSCRSLKAKCDESKPCQSCRDKNIECTYRQPEPKAQDKIQTDMLQKIQTILDEASSVKSMLTEATTKSILHEVMVLSNNILQLNKRMQMLEERLVGSPPTPRCTDGVKPDTEPELENGVPSSQQSVKSHQSDDTMIRDGRPLEHEEQEPTVWQDAASDEETGPPINPSRPKFGIQHTTGAAEMLNWTPIADLVSDEVKDRRVSKGKGSQTDRYLMKAEKRRGEVRLYGYGEGPAAKYSRDYDSVRSDTQVSGSDASWPPVFSDPPFDYIATRIPGRWIPEDWFGHRSKDEQLGGYTPEGTLDLREHVVHRLVKNYMDKMNILHPILTQSEVNRLVKDFLAEVKLQDGKSSSSVSKPVPPTFVNSPTLPSVLGKRSRDQQQDTPKPNTRLPLPQRSPANAVVLLMLGIGKIMEAKRIPEVCWGDKNMSSSDLRKVKGSASPDHSSPSSPISSSQPSPHSQNIPPLAPTSMSLAEDEQNSITGKPRPTKNSDVLHGMAYVAAATDIIGNELSGSTIRHIQADILAALYFGQLVRPVQSHAFLHLASRAIQEEIRLKPSLLVTQRDEMRFCQPKDNPLVYAFWTCLQLECDIVAELACVHSGILGFEEVMPYPNTQESYTKDSMDMQVALSYDAQLWLRRHLNGIHEQYEKSNLHSDYVMKNGRFKSIEAVELSRTNQFGFNPVLKESGGTGYIWPQLVWDFDAKSPQLAKDILSARTRAKFYGARVITYRPFVKAILAYSWRLQHSTYGEIPPVESVDPGALSGVELPALEKFDKDPNLPLEQKIQTPVGRAYWGYFQLGIKALIHSTEAFHGLDHPRLIVTNIFGTLHAQWGNVLVLLACYRDESLRPELFKFIAEDKFKRVVRKTLWFLKESAPKFSGLHIDSKILKAAAFKAGLFTNSELENMGTPLSSDDPILHRISESFSGSNSHDT